MSGDLEVAINNLRVNLQGEVQRGVVEGERCRFRSPVISLQKQSVRIPTLEHHKRRSVPVFVSLNHGEAFRRRSEMSIVLRGARRVLVTTCRLLPLLKRRLSKTDSSGAAAVVSAPAQGHESHHHHHHQVASFHADFEMGPGEPVVNCPFKFVQLVRVATFHKRAQNETGGGALFGGERATHQHALCLHSLLSKRPSSSMSAVGRVKVSEAIVLKTRSRK